MADNFPSEAAFLDAARGLCTKVGQWQDQWDALSSVQLRTKLHKEAATLEMLLEYTEVSLPCSNTPSLRRLLGKVIPFFYSPEMVKLSFDAIPNLNRNSPAYCQAERLRKGKHPKTTRMKLLASALAWCFLSLVPPPNVSLSLGARTFPSDGMHRAETLMCTAQSIQQLYKTFIDTNADIEKYLKYSDARGSSGKL
ncbi:hypothetical protein BDQ17DRAFT_1436130 [Cyathus striatus]|nr:hypothetical protein BDQ17DRAFT_1436130 [Cyathus striatus]